MKQSTRSGFSLLELIIATTIMMLVSAMTMMVVMSSAEQNQLGEAKGQVISDLRNTMHEVTSDVRQAYTDRTVDADPPLAPEDAFSVVVLDGGTRISYCIPEPSDDSPIPVPSAPITIRWENEDANANGELDPGEDSNGDGVLTRRLVRDRNGVTEILGSANNISNVAFTLEESPADNDDTENVLVIQLAASRPFGVGEERPQANAALQSRIQLEN